jgi:hypothetical protein
MPEHYDLETFRTRHFDNRPGHHAAFFGPTQQAGKTTMAFALLESVANPDLPAIVLCKKHTDRVVSAWTRRLDFRETPAWPPRKKLGDVGRKLPGYTLWPRQSLSDPAADNALLGREFTRAIVHNRKHRPSITFADELYGLLAELHMRDLLTSVITQDSGSGHGLWFASQKPSGTQGISIPGFFFNSAEHMFLSKDGEERNRARYGEIACGISPREIERETLRLSPYSWLYIRRSGPEWCVVDAYDPALAI